MELTELQAIVTALVTLPDTCPYGVFVADLPVRVVTEYRDGVTLAAAIRRYACLRVAGYTDVSVTDLDTGEVHLWSVAITGEEMTHV
jgi:hypothetical protein